MTLDTKPRQALTSHSPRAITDSNMSQLIVRNIEEKIVRKLKQRAGERGVSMEEEHRRRLRESLFPKPDSSLSFKDFLLTMPNVGNDEDFARDKTPGRNVKL